MLPITILPSKIFLWGLWGLCLFDLPKRDLHNMFAAMTLKQGQHCPVYPSMLLYYTVDFDLKRCHVVPQNIPVLEKSPYYENVNTHVSSISSRNAVKCCPKTPNNTFPSNCNGPTSNAALPEKGLIRFVHIRHPANSRPLQCNQLMPSPPVTHFLGVQAFRK